MESPDDICACGHLQSSHRTYGCTGWKPNTDHTKVSRTWCQCKAFQPKEVMRPNLQTFARWDTKRATTQGS